MANQYTTSYDPATKQTSYTTSAIPVDTLAKPVTPINVPNQPAQGLVGLTGMVGTGNAAVEAGNNAVNQTMTENKPVENKTPAPEAPWYKAVLDTLKPEAPASTETMYTDAAKTAGIDEKTALVNQTKQELDALNAELVAVNNETKANVLKEGQRWASGGTISGAQANYEREAAIRTLPLQSQILAKQAQLTGNQATLKAAEDKLATVFKLKSDDATRAYEYRVKLFDNAMTIANEAQKTALQNKKDEISRNQVSANDVINNAQSISGDAFSKGDYATAAAITTLQVPDPMSKTFSQDVINYNKKLAELQGKMSTIPSAANTQIVDVGGNKVLIDQRTGNTIKVIGSSSSNKANDYANALKFVQDNPNTKPEELEKLIRSNTTNLSEADIKSLLPSKKFLSEDYFKQSLKTQSDADLQKAAEESGYRHWYTSWGSEKDNYINDKAKEYWGLVKQYQDAGYTDDEIIKLMK